MATMQRASTWRLIGLCFRKDLLRRRRAPLGVIVMIAFPLFFSGGIAVVFGGDGDNPLPRVKLLIEDQDGEIAGQLLLGVFQSDEMNEFVDVEKVVLDENNDGAGVGRARMEKGEASALLIIPDKTTERLLKGEPVAFELVRNPAQGIMPEIAEQISGTLTDVLAIGLRGLWAQAEALGLEDIAEMDSLEALDALSDADFAKVTIAFRRAGRVLTRYLNEPPIDFARVEVGKEEEAEGDAGKDEDEEEPDHGIMVFLFVLPGIAVYSLFVIGDQSMRDLLVEAKEGTLRRQVTAPIGVPHVLAGKVLVTMMVAAVALVILAVVVALVLPHSIDVMGFTGLAFAVVLAVTGLSALIYGLAGDESRGGAASTVIYLTLAFTSGSFFPVPEALEKFAPISPFYWGTTGFRDLLNQAPLADVLPAIGVMVAVGVVGLAIGSWRLHRLLIGGKLA